MFNSPLLDVTIGLVFIFLVYSLLVTSVNEVIATLFCFRAKMLKRAIIAGMLSDTENDTQLVSLMKGVYYWIGLRKLVKLFLYYKKTFQDRYDLEIEKGKNKMAPEIIIVNSFFNALIKVFTKKQENANTHIGYQFYNHPIIKNYGSSRFFSLPSYISSQSFSTVLLEVLKTDFNEKINNPQLQNSSDIIKIRELLKHYETDSGNKEPRFLDKDTRQILQKYLEESQFKIENFSKKLEEWFDDTMKRVSGWYKRQIQFTLFAIGLVLAITFNVDTIKIANKLSVDKDAREKMVQLAITAADKYKDDPRVKETNNETQINNDSTNIKIFNEYQAKLDSVNEQLKDEIKNTNGILALGWDLDTLTKPLQEMIHKTNHQSLIDSVLQIKNLIAECKQKKNQKPADERKADSIQFSSLLNHLIASKNDFPEKQDSLENYLKMRCLTNKVKATDTLLFSHKLLMLIKDSINPDFSRIDKISIIPDKTSDSLRIEGRRTYTKIEVAGLVMHKTFSGSVWLGFLITAFAISLGAPFWFDLLNKLVKLRTAGKKEETGDTSTEKAPVVIQAPPQPSTTINVNQPQKPGEEAVG